MRAPLFVCLMLAAGAGLAAEARTFSERVPAGPSDPIQICNTAGSIAISAWDRPEIDIQARLGRDVERVDVHKEGARHVVKVVLPNRPFRGSRDAEAAVTVRIPPGSELEVCSVSAEVKVSGIRGSVHLRSVSGNIAADVPGKYVAVKTVSGNVKLRGSGQPAEMRVATVSGNLNLKDAAGDLDVNSTSGELEVALKSVRSVRARTVSGSLAVRGRLLPDARIEAETVSGRIAVETPAEAGFQYDVSSFSGRITNCFGAEASRPNRYGPGSQLNGTRGEGAATVRLKSMSGAIELCDR